MCRVQPNWWVSKACEAQKATHRKYATGFEQELSVLFIVVLAPSIVLGMSGKLEKMLRKVFKEAKVCTFHPCRELNHLNVTHHCHVESSTLSAIH